MFDKYYKKEYICTILDELLSRYQRLEMNRYKLMFSAAVLTAIVLLTAVSCSRDGDSGSWASPTYEEAGTVSIAVEAMTVTTGLLVPEIRSSGVAEGIREAWVVSETEGLVTDVSYSLGDRVEPGDILMSVDADLALRNRDLAEQQYRTALLEFQAAEKSNSSGSISALQFSQVTDRFYAAEASRAAAVDAFENTSLKAPFSGVVALRDSSIGIGTLLNRGVRVARIVDDSAFRTELSVGEGQVLLVREGAPAFITGSDGVVRNGTVSAVSAGSNPGTGSYTVVVEWIPQNGDPLRSGMAVDVALTVQGETEQIIIPVSAIRLRGGEQFVFVASGETAEVRKVRTGSRLGERVEVLEGLEPDEVLVTSGLASLTPDAPVTVTLIGSSGDA